MVEESKHGNFVTFRLEVKSMRMAIATALMDHHEVIQKQVNAEVEALVGDDNFSTMIGDIVRKELARVLQQEVSTAVYRSVRDSKEVSDLVTTIVRKSMESSMRQCP